MNKLDLIIDALRIANFEGSNPFPNKATKDIYVQALAYARELRALEPVAWRVGELNFRQFRYCKGFFKNNKTTVAITFCTRRIK